MRSHGAGGMAHAWLHVCCVWCERGIRYLAGGGNSPMIS